LDIAPKTSFFGICRPILEGMGKRGIQLPVDRANLNLHNSFVNCDLRQSNDTSRVFSWYDESPLLLSKTGWNNEILTLIDID